MSKVLFQMKSIKKWFVSLFVVSSALAIFSPAPIFAATLSLNPSTGIFNRGCNVSLAVELDTQGTQTDGTDAILHYDSAEVTPLTIINGTIYPDYPGNFIDVQGQKINISGLASVTEAFSGKGTLATINFTVPQSAALRATQITFDFDPNDKTKTTDSNVVERGTVADVLNAVVNGNYTIGSGSTCPIGGQGQAGPTATPSASPIVATASPSASPKVLPNSGFTGPTMILAIAGGILTVLGILGLALL